MLSHRQKKNDNPILAQEIIKKRSNVLIWLLPVLVISLLFLYWYFRPFHKKEAKLISTTTLQKLTPIKLGNITLPNGVILSMPNNSIEEKLLKFIQDPTQKISDKHWFHLDDLIFDSTKNDTTTEDKTHIKNIAAILNAYPNVKIKIGGYSSSIPSEKNINLSQAKAQSLRKELINDYKISPDRVIAESYTEQNPIASHNTTQGKTQNSGVSINVIQK
ncbi:MAG: OmpA family protein [Candidatus Dasytiphilus stammeri]